MKGDAALIAGVASLCIVAACSTQHTATAVSADKPSSPKPINIVYIMADDHGVQAIGAYGHPISKLAPTPNIDRIAAQGMLFTNSFVTNSLCGPSRASMLTGKYGHINGLKKNGETFATTQATWPKTLKEAGYQTAMIGKWHLGKNPEGMQFDFWKIFNDQGEYYNPDIITQNGTVRYAGYASDLVTQFSLEWLRKQRDPEKPFALLVHHKAPHRNWMPAPRHTRQYEDTEFPVPWNYFDDYSGRRAAAEQEMNIYRDMYEGHDLKMTVAVGSGELRFDPWGDHFDRMTTAQRAAWDTAYQARNDAMNSADLNEREMALWKYQRYVRDYLATISAVDDSVGAILDYLEESGLAENTLVVYTSDQGFYLGEHGWFDKRFMYEESLRTPLLAKLPGRIESGSTSTDMVLNIDYAPTFLELAGIEVHDDIQGESLADIMIGEAQGNLRQAIYYQYYEYPGFHAVRRHYGIRTDRYKLIHFYGDIDSWEFYDLETDPGEMHNRIDEPSLQPRILELRRQLRLLRTRYRVPSEEN